jgi:hypothetical protein
VRPIVSGASSPVAGDRAQRRRIGKRQPIRDHDADELRLRDADGARIGVLRARQRRAVRKPCAACAPAHATASGSTDGRMWTRSTIVGIPSAGRIPIAHQFIS